MKAGLKSVVNVKTRQRIHMYHHFTSTTAQPFLNPSGNPLGVPLLRGRLRSVPGSYWLKPSECFSVPYSWGSNGNAYAVYRENNSKTCLKIVNWMLWVLIILTINTYFPPVLCLYQCLITQLTELLIKSLYNGVINISCKK